MARRRRRGKTDRGSLDASRAPRALVVCAQVDLHDLECEVVESLLSCGWEVVRHPCTRPLGLAHYEGTAQAVLDSVSLVSDGLHLSRQTGPFSLILGFGWRSATTAHALGRALGCPFAFVLDSVAARGREEDQVGAPAYVAAIESWACGEADLVVVPDARPADEVAGACSTSSGGAGTLSTLSDLPDRLQRLASGTTIRRPSGCRPMPAPGRAKLRIVVDMPWDASAHMGTGAYSEAMVRALARSAGDAELVLVVDSKPSVPIDLPNIYYMTVDASGDVPDGWRHTALPAALRRHGADVLFCPATLCPAEKVCPTVVTVHDLTFRTHPQYYADTVVAGIEAWFDRSLAVADRIVVVSEKTKADLVDMSGEVCERITVIPPPVRDIFLDPPPAGEVESLLLELDVSRPFFLHVSNLAPHKNVAFAIEVLGHFLARKPGSGCSLVVGGGANAPNTPTDFMARAREEGLGDRVRYVGRVSDRQLRALYHGCEAFLFPSLVEGWGMPVAEAAACGQRVLASRVPAALSVGAEILELDSRAWAERLEAQKRGGHASVPRDAGKLLLDVLAAARDAKPYVRGAGGRRTRAGAVRRRRTSPRPRPGRADIVTAGHREVEPWVSVHIVASERDEFGCMLLGSCLESLKGYADEVILVDNGLCGNAKAVLAAMGPELAIRTVPGRGVEDFAALRNLALQATKSAATHVHWVDTDEVYFPVSLKEIKASLRDRSLTVVSASRLHLMIQPELVESRQTKAVAFRFTRRLKWRGKVHEELDGVDVGGPVATAGSYLHFAYCRPQWQTMLKWLKYATLQCGEVSPYRYEFVDGVRRPWFRGSRTPDTILDTRRPHLQAYPGPYPPSVMPWLEEYAASGLSWHDWVAGKVDGRIWERWQELRREVGNWEDTLEGILEFEARQRQDA